MSVPGYRLVDGEWVPARVDAPRCLPINREHVAVQLPRWHKHAPRVNKLGQPVFLNQREIDDFTAKTGGRYRWGEVPEGMPKKPRKPKLSYARPRS